LLPGDRPVSVAGLPVANAEEFVKAIRSNPEKMLHLVVERSGRDIDLTLRPESKHDVTDGGRSVGVIGASIRGRYLQVEVRYGPVESVRRGVNQTWDVTAFSARMIGKMVLGEVSLRNLSGPLTIADYAGQSARLGWIVFASFLAFISISIGLMNLLPIPMLDGGHLLYHLVEIITGHPPSERVLEWSQRAGMAVLAGLMTVALFNDFSRLLS